MNTILTDDEREEIFQQCADADEEVVDRYGRAIEAAVLAKLREQEPQDIAHVGQGLVDVWKSRAAPEAPAKECGLCGSGTPFTGSCGGGRENPRALCFAAPEAPAQGEARKDRMQKVRDFIQADADLARGIASTEAPAQEKSNG